MSSDHEKHTERTSCLARLIRFFTTDIWMLPVGGEMKHEHSLGMRWLKIFMVAGRHFYRKNMFVRDVPALTFSTLIAVVPVVALIFALAKIAGSDFNVERWLYNTFEAQPQVADTLARFATNYLEHTKSGYIVGAGVVMMLYTVFSLLQKIERTFNKIWHTRKGRTWWRMATDYTAIFLVIVVLMFISSAMAITLGTFAETLDRLLHAGSLLRQSLKFVPYVALVLSFLFLYKTMPSPRVRWRTVVIPSLLSGVLIAALQYYYLKLQIGLTGYNVIYGAFAALPLFLLWLEIIWAISLYGVELCYAIQNLAQFDYNMQVYDLSHEQHTLAAVVVMSSLCRSYDKAHQPLAAADLQTATALPQQLVDYALQRLVDIGLVHVRRQRRYSTPRYVPTSNPKALTVGELLRRMESYAVYNDRQHVIHLDSPLWQDILRFKQNYLSRCDAVFLRDL